MKAVTRWLAAEDSVRSCKTTVRVIGSYGAPRRRIQS